MANQVEEGCCYEERIAIIINHINFAAAFVDGFDPGRYIGNKQQ